MKDSGWNWFILDRKYLSHLRFLRPEYGVFCGYGAAVDDLRMNCSRNITSRCHGSKPLPAGIS